jgi:AcrR family transcriptional regulator
MEETLSRRERKKQETRLQLIKAALQLFREHGYDATTVEQIADAADVAKGTFFNYFETKETILPALVEWRLQELGAALTPEQGAPASPVARIKLGLRLIASDPLADHALARQVFGALAQQRQMPTAPPTSPLSPPFAAGGMIGLLARQVQQAQEAGEIRADLDAVYLARVICTLFFQQMMMWHHGYRPTPPSFPPKVGGDEGGEVLDAALDLLLDGIAGPKWKKT